MKKIILIIIIIVIAVGLSGGAVWYWQKVKLEREKANNSVLPPKYLSQMESCKAEGGKVQETTISRGTWTMIYQWMCECQNNQQFFSQEKLECNKWLMPAD